LQLTCNRKNLSCNPRATENMSFATHAQLECTVNGSMGGERRLIDKNRYHEATSQSSQKTSQPTYTSGQQQHKYTQTTQKSEHESTNTKYKSPSARLKLIKYKASDFQQIHWVRLTLS
jgi:hypothetical protein